MASLSLPEKLSLTYRLLGLPPYVLSRVICKNVLHKNPFQSIKRTAFDAMMYYTGHLSIRQMKALSTPTRAVFEEFVTSQKLTYAIEQIEHGASLLWLGRRSEGKSLLYFHGGGYVLPMAPMHLSFLRYIQEEYERVRGVALNVAILEYSLAPEHPFPAQLCQAASALSHLLASGLASSDIIIGGDSAGGNLALVLAGHLLHPHPAVAALDLRSPLAGILLISPGIIYNPADIPMTHTTDIFHPLTYKRMFELIPLDTRPGAWAGREAVRAPEGWWARLETLAPRVLLTSGEAEVLYVPLCELGRRLETEACGVRVESLSEPGAPHMNPVVDLSDMGDGPGMGAKRIAAWVAES